MTVSVIDTSQRNAARVAGLAFLISFASIVSTSFGIFFRVNELGSAAEAARWILANERLFRLGIAGLMVNCVALVVLVTALYVLFEPVNRNLALFVAFSRLVHLFVWVLVTVNLFTALRVLHDADSARAFGPNGLPALAQLYRGSWDTYNVGLLFWALATAVGSGLLFKSNYIPRALAAVGVISSAWCITCTLVFYVFPEFANVVNVWWFDTPMVVFELVLSSWLLFKGLRPSGIPARAVTSAVEI